MSLTSPIHQIPSDVAEKKHPIVVGFKDQIPNSLIKVQENVNGGNRELDQLMNIEGFSWEVNPSLNIDKEVDRMTGGAHKGGI